MYDFDSAMRAYHEDVAFRTLVSTLEAAIHSLQISPGRPAGGLHVRLP
jgi:hypothetical protein